MQVAIGVAVVLAVAAVAYAASADLTVAALLLLVTVLAVGSLGLPAALAAAAVGFLALNWLFTAELHIGDHVILWREIVGNGFGLASALGGMRRRVWAWPVGIIGNVLLFTVFMGAVFDTPQFPIPRKRKQDALQNAEHSNQSRFRME